jgi:hypothetical protein
MTDPTDKPIRPGEVRPKTFEEMTEGERYLYGPRPAGRKRRFNPVWDQPGDADINNEVDDD